MSKELSKPVLVLNKSWNPIHVARVSDMICDIVAGTKSVLDPESYILYDWDGWLELPILEGHRFIQATRGLKIRTPEVVICAEYNKLPSFNVKLTTRNLWLRDGGRCQYTGKKISLKEATRDHVMPESRGGRSSWDNLVICDRDINIKKGNKTPEEAGLKLIKPPREPKWSPLYSTTYLKKHPTSWNSFLPQLSINDSSLVSAVIND